MMLLEGRNAVIYGGGGPIGGAIAGAFAREGARVFLAGRTLARLDAVSTRIRAAGGRTETAQLDALDGSTLLGRAASRDDVANASVFVASDLGRSLTGAALNISCGTLLD